MSISLLLRALALSALAACGRGGGADAGEPPITAGPPPPPPELGLRSVVGFDALAYRLDGLVSCLAREEGPKLPSLPRLMVDGALDEWQVGADVVTDPQGDAPPGLDLGRLLLARRGDDLALALDLPPPEAVGLWIEVGGLIARKGALQPEIRRLFRYQAGVLSDMQEGSLQPIAPGQAAVHFGSGGGEILLKGRLLGEVVTYPVWWLRVFTRRGAEAAFDSTPAIYYPSLLEADDQPFELSRCTRWTGKPGRTELVQIQDAKAALDGVPAGFPIELAAERAYQLTRLAFDAAQNLWGGEEALPPWRLTTVATTNRVLPLVDLTGAGLEDAFESRPYRALLFDVRALAPDAAAHFPQGDTLAEAASTYLELALRRQWPGAPWYLVEAMGQGLLGHLLRRHVGTAYWLDALVPAVAPFLAEVDTPAPLPLSLRAAKLADRSWGSPEERLAVQRLAEAKARGLGFRLGEEFAVPALAGLWREASSLQEGGDGGGERLAADRVFLQALAKSKGGDQVGRERMTRLGEGWLIPGPYGEGLGPETLADADRDGVPDFVESLRGTSPGQTDTDGDGWSDGAEVVLGTDPRLTSQTPGVLVPDGHFGDWQQLVPKRLIIDRGRSGRCAKAADIDLYAAMASRGVLLVAALAAEFWDGEAAATWELDLDLPKAGRQLLVVAKGDAHELEVKDPQRGFALVKRLAKAAPPARRVFEVALDEKTLGLPVAFDQPEAVRLRLRTIFHQGVEPLICDETGWFTPFISG